MTSLTGVSLGDKSIRDGVLQTVECIFDKNADCLGFLYITLPFLQLRVVHPHFGIHTERGLTSVFVHYSSSVYWLLAICHGVRIPRNAYDSRRKWKRPQVSHRDPEVDSGGGVKVTCGVPELPSVLSIPFPSYIPLGRLSTTVPAIPVRTRGPCED